MRHDDDDDDNNIIIIIKYYKYKKNKYKIKKIITHKKQLLYK